MLALCFLKIAQNKATCSQVNDRQIAVITKWIFVSAYWAPNWRYLMILPGGSILYGGNLQTWSLIWLLLNLQFQVIASIGIIILGIISAALGTYSSVKKIAENYWALGQLLSVEATTRFQVWNSKWSGFTYDQNFARTTEFPVDYYYYYSDHNSLLQ